MELRKDFVSKRDSSVKNSDREKYYNDHLKTIDKNLKSKGFDVDEEHAKVQKSIAETQGEIEETDKKITPLVEERLKKQGIKFLSGSVIIHGHGESSTSVDYRLEGDQAIRSETIKYGSTDVEAKDKEIGDILEKYTAVARDPEKVKSLHDQLQVSKKELEALKAGKDSGIGKTLQDLADLKVKKQDLENKLKDFVPSKPDPFKDGLAEIDNFNFKKGVSEDDFSAVLGKVSEKLEESTEKYEQEGAGQLKEQYKKDALEMSDKVLVSLKKVVGKFDKYRYSEYVKYEDAQQILSESLYEKKYGKGYYNNMKIEGDENTGFTATRYRGDDKVDGAILDSNKDKSLLRHFKVREDRPNQIVYLKKIKEHLSKFMGDLNKSRKELGARELRLKTVRGTLKVV